MAEAKVDEKEKLPDWLTLDESGARAIVRFAEYTAHLKCSPMGLLYDRTPFDKELGLLAGRIAQLIAKANECTAEELRELADKQEAHRILAYDMATMTIAATLLHTKDGGPDWTFAGPDGKTLPHPDTVCGDDRRALFRNIEGKAALRMASAVAYLDNF